MEWQVKQDADGRMGVEATGKSGIRYFVFLCGDGGWSKIHTSKTGEKLSQSPHRSDYAARQDAERYEEFALLTQELETIALKHEGRGSVRLESCGDEWLYVMIDGVIVATFARMSRGVWQYRPVVLSRGGTRTAPTTYHLSTNDPMY